MKARRGKQTSASLFDVVRTVGLGLPGVEAATKYDGSPMLKVGGSFMAGLATHRSAEPGTLVHLPAGTVHWFRFGKEGGQMISMTSREAASAMFAHMDREISPDAPDLERLAAIAGQHETQLAI